MDELELRLSFARVTDPGLPFDAPVPMSVHYNGADTEPCARGPTCRAGCACGTARSRGVRATLAESGRPRA